MIENKYLEKFDGNPGLTESSLTQLKLPNTIPKDYFELIKIYNGGEGFIGEEYLVLYKTEELKEINEGYEVEKFDSNIFIIGSNGAGEAIAFDFRNETVKYILIPFIFEYDAIIELGNNANEFFQRLYEKGYFNN